MGTLASDAVQGNAADQLPSPQIYPVEPNGDLGIPLCHPWDPHEIGHALHHHDYLFTWVLRDNHRPHIAYHSYEKVYLPCIQHTYLTY